ncbi:hypothetical protein DSM25558_4510 [Agrobacterium sp. DSM 25558]|uniref:DUF5623 domain-containing protein n=1 Tax=Agrobacterium sp. DSM 25558 TaxID=1907665 RepID=UPI00097259E3|nr:DUF5623 domain-containing protein [Agrobacterium sp. DSM 25558]SCX28585.1 hypothetical protein DSM25558_4510 [Agrobacterium sp. DSM 25558]
MLNGKVRPTTLDGIKRLASQIRKEQGLKHALALDLAANAANYANFRNAQRVFNAAVPADSPPYVLLTRYWMDTTGRRSGRETLRINLPRPLLEIYWKPELKKVRGLEEFRKVANDHFVCDLVDPSQSYARERLCTSERSLRFMEHTGLRPLRNPQKAYQNGSVNDELPDRDHTTLWVDPASGQFILIDEPYAQSPDEEARAAWAIRTGWRVAKTSWPGMYNPYSCDLYVATDGRSGYDLDGLLARIEAMPAPLVEADWPGESVSSWDTFISPLAKNALDRRRARCRGTIYPVASAMTIPCSYSVGSSRRRPAGELGVAGHIEVGRIIKAVLRSNHRPYGAYRRLNSVRSTLEGWMSLEIGRGQLNGPEFFEVYYTEVEGDAPYLEMAKSPQDVVVMLLHLKQKLKAGYPDCAPLRQQLHRIDMSVSLTRKMIRAGV